MQERTILIFPRTTTPSRVRVPPHLARHVRVDVAEGYRDPVPLLSSTKLRQAMAEAGSQPPNGLHPAVWERAKALGTYVHAPLAPSTRRLHVAVLGPPGCGKTTLCR